MVDDFDKYAKVPDEYVSLNPEAFETAPKVIQLKKKTIDGFNHLFWHNKKQGKLSILASRPKMVS